MSEGIPAKGSLISGSVKALKLSDNRNVLMFDDDEEGSGTEEEQKKSHSGPSLKTQPSKDSSSTSSVNERMMIGSGKPSLNN